MQLHVGDFCSEKLGGKWFPLWYLMIIFSRIHGLAKWNHQLLNLQKVKEANTMTSSQELFFPLFFSQLLQVPVGVSFEPNGMWNSLQGFWWVTRLDVRFLCFIGANQPPTRSSCWAPPKCPKHSGLGIVGNFAPKNAWKKHLLPRSIPCNWWLVSYSSMVCIQMWSRPSMFRAGIVGWLRQFFAKRWLLGWICLWVFWEGFLDNMHFCWWRGKGQVTEIRKGVDDKYTCTVFDGKWCLASTWLGFCLRWCFTLYHGIHHH